MPADGPPTFDPDRPLNAFDLDEAFRRVWRRLPYVPPGSGLTIRETVAGTAVVMDDPGARIARVKIGPAGIPGRISGLPTIVASSADDCLLLANTGQGGWSETGAATITLYNGLDGGLPAGAEAWAAEIEGEWHLLGKICP
jgi:hypothetical protein